MRTPENVNRKREKAKAALLHSLKRLARPHLITLDMGREIVRKMLKTDLKFRFRTLEI